MSDFIPWDVFPDILVRLPPKDLFRCTCVCKEWQCLITNPTFIKTHFTRHYNDSISDLLLVRNCRFDQRIQKENGCIEHVQEIYSLYRDVGDTVTKYRDLNFSVDRALCCFYRIIGSCNGVICLSDDEDHLSTYTIILWNPVVEKRIKLPKFRVTYESHGSFEHMVGFGCDSKTCDYKVLRIVEPRGDFSDRFPFEVDIYSSGTGNWRNISHSALNLSFCMECRNPQTLFGESLHWLVSDYYDSSKSVLSFDLTNEVFNCIGLPTDIRVQSNPPRYLIMYYKHCVLRLAVIGGSFCVVQLYKERYCVWMMKEYGVTSSWTKILNADLPRMVDRVVGFGHNGKLFIESRKSLFTFVPDTLLLTELGIIRDGEGFLYKKSFHTDNFIETLGLVGVEHMENPDHEEDNEEVEEM